MYLVTNFNCYVYWIHLTSHTWEQGYIGVSIAPSRRFSEHRSYTNTILSHKIHIHGDDIIYDVIYCGTEDSCYELEEFLRPTPYTGWNKARGGRYCPSLSLKGIKKSKPAWNKGMKMPRTPEENARRRQQWEEKFDSGYVHPNTKNSLGNTNRRGKEGPPMPEKTRAALLMANTGTDRHVDKTIRTFHHKDGRVEKCTTLELRNLYGINQGNLCSMINGHRKSAGGWRLIV